ncbi:polysaccharide biosynthesis C-terminal domain-containing protein [Schlegelella sp. S2-27]|uniref:Polysaccharide biosynthesis C-terminal domain-containing protein n=1 Tax=Caldimonas mangrovi TaxID=2944811 RepID=A0ABT0YRE3_9BURK|nr:polysaccharide biosynthesis C-terminal domain-containing protein [Caldimonas mangrovi]MCM5680837.1 polysaccharide biosynthesis C-terminal domain-containing protein [Caldimonas mangrovi]
MSSSSISRGAISHFVAKSLAVALGMTIIAIVARQGPLEQGMFSLLVATEAVYAALFSGIGLAVARRVSHHGDEAGVWLTSALLLCLLAGLVGAGVFAGAAHLSGGDPAYRYLPLLAAAAPFLLLTPTVSGLHLGRGRMGPINLLTVGPPLLTLALLPLVAKGAFDAMAMATTWVVARAVVGVAAAVHASASFGLRRIAWSDWAPLAGFCAVVGVTNLISWLNYRVDLFIVERIAGLAQAGVYSVAVTVAELLWFVSSSVSVAAYARIGQPDRARAAALTVRVVHLNLAVLVLVSPALVALAWWGLPAVLGPAYAASLPLLAWLLPGVWAYASASTLSAFYTNYLGRPQLSAAVASTSLAVNVVVCFLLVPRVGAAGAAIATSASYLLAIGWGLALFRRHAGLSWREVLRPDLQRLRRDLVSPLQRAAR